MNTIEKLTWQKKAGIISETQYRESVEALTSEESVRNMIKEALVDLLAEKKKAKENRTINLLGYTVEDFIQVCGQGQGDQQIDHKIPVTWFKEGAPIDVIWHLQNL